MWAAILIGAGMALTAAWSGAPALYPGVITRLEKVNPRFAGCEWQGVPWFQSHGQWGARGYNNLAPGDAFFFDWDLDGTADHVGIVIGTGWQPCLYGGGKSGDACKIKSYDLKLSKY